MKRIRLVFFANAVTILCLAALSCGEKPQRFLESPSSPAEPAVVDNPDPASFSFAAVLGSASLEEISRVEFADPFPRAFTVSRGGLSALPAGEGEAQVLFGEAGEGSPHESSDWGESRRGDLRYRVSDGALVAETGAEKENGDAASRELWRFVPEFRVSAGLATFSDAVVAATERPSLIVVDRKTGTLIREKEIRTQPVGPLFYLEALSLLVAVNSDGTASAFSLSPGSAVAADPVEAFLRPSAAALGRIEGRLKERLGKPDEKPRLVFAPYGPRDAIPEEAVALFRLDGPAGQKSRLYIKDGGDRPYLLEIFSSDGEELASNLDYLGAEAVLEYVFAGESPYFAAAAALSREGSSSALPRLAIVPK